MNGVIYNLCIAESNSHTGTLKLDGSWKIFSLGFAILEVFFLMNRSFFSRHSHGPPKCCFVDLFLQSWKLTYPTGRKRSAYILCINLSYTTTPEKLTWQWNNQPLEDLSPISNVDFPIPFMLVFGGVGGAITAASEVWDFSLFYSVINQLDARISMSHCDGVGWRGPTPEVSDTEGNT